MVRSPGGWVFAVAVVVAVVVGCDDDASSEDGAGAGGNGEAAGPGSGGGGASTSGGAAGAGAGATGGEGGEAPEIALVHRVGRFDDSDPDALRFSWSGTSFRTRIEGTALSVRLDGAADIFFEVVVDGASVGQLVTQGGDVTHEVVTGLPAGTHDVEIHRRNEGFFGEVVFRGFEPGPETTLVESPSPYERRLEFIGDSITCGYGIEGLEAGCPFEAATESAYTTYASIAARNVSAAAHLIAYSGKGVYQNYGGDQDELMPELYERTLTADPALAWDFSSFIPDAVVINLGTNDFSAAIAGEDFIGAYVDLLGTVRGHYPDAEIFCVSWQGWGGNQALLGQAVDQFADPKVHEVEFWVDAEDGWGCDYHPNLTTHAELGAVLTQAFQSTLGW